MENTSPPIVITDHKLNDQHRQIHIVREDLLPGGTKQRAAIPFLQHFKDQGIKHVTYASPFCGFAQLALALAAEQLDLSLTLFCEEDPETGKAHALTQQAASHGASIELTETLSEAEHQANNFARETRAQKIPLGLKHEVFLNHYRKCVAEQLERLNQTLDLKTLWLPVGSGTLVGVFRNMLPKRVTLNCVDVRVLPNEDLRLQGLRSLPNVKLYRAPERFQEKSVGRPPVPSNCYYDAKLWTFINLHAADGDVWWNVAR